MVVWMDRFYVGLQEREQRNSNVYGIQEHGGIDNGTVRRKETCVIKDGGYLSEVETETLEFRCSLSCKPT